jgi:hypothetical protein
LVVLNLNWIALFIFCTGLVANSCLNSTVSVTSLLDCDRHDDDNRSTSRSKKKTIATWIDRRQRSNRQRKCWAWHR